MQPHSLARGELGQSFWPRRRVLPPAPAMPPRSLVAWYRAVAGLAMDWRRWWWRGRAIHRFFFLSQKGVKFAIVFALSVQTPHKHCFYSNGTRRDACLLCRGAFT